MNRAPFFILVHLIAVLLADNQNAVAQSGQSRYVTFDLDKCAVVERDEENGSIIQRCDGPGGFAFHVAEGDLRFFLGYGPKAREQRAFTQTLPPFNTIHNTLELRSYPGEKDPYAVILRYFTDSGLSDGSPNGQVLVVTKLAGGEACHTAYIDALANKNANELARQAADDSEVFDCAADEPQIVGKSPM